MSAGRDDPCPCGSGKKFKRCCGEPRRDLLAEAAAFALTRAHDPSDPEAVCVLEFRRHATAFGVLPVRAT